MRIYKLYNFATSTTNASAELDVQKSGRIVAILGSAKFESTTDGSDCTIELSKASVNQTSVNNPIGPLAQITWQANLSTNGAPVGQVNMALPGLSIPVATRDRLYMHFVISGTVTASGTFYAYII